MVVNAPVVHDIRTPNHDKIISLVLAKKCAEE